MSNSHVTGIGGIFFKCKDPKTIKLWYKENLGMNTDQYGCLFEFRSSENPDQKAYLQWSPFKDDTSYFDPSDKEFMINYRVKNIEQLVESLKANGINICDDIEVYEYGKFVHILDPENNKIELWEPIDQAFTDQVKGETNN
ncbi:MAG TPA: VOC family protein [Cyclobacteriaceae bacterium]